MHAAQVLHFGDPPQYVEIANEEAPAADHVQIKVLAVGLHGRKYHILEKFRRRA